MSDNRLLRFVAVQAVTGVLGEDEGHAVQLLLTQRTPEAGGMELSVQRPQDLLLDRKVAVSALGESLLQTSQDYISPSQLDQSLYTNQVVSRTDKLPIRPHVVVTVQDN